MTEEMLEIFERVEALLEEKKFNQLKNLLKDMNEVDIADILDEASREHTVLIFRLLPKVLASEVFAYMEPETREELLEVITDKELQSVMRELFVDDAVDILDEMPAGVVKRMLRLTSPEDRRDINRILQYPEDSAGSLLTTEFVDLKATTTVAAAFEHIRKTGTNKETIYTCYITDSNRHLEGVVTVKELLLAEATTKVGDLMETNIISAVTTDDQEYVAGLFDKYDFMALPVVDKENRLVGIITVDDVVDIMREEATEDIEKMAAILPGDKPYLKTGVFETAKNRIPWLILLMFLATFTGMIMASFENALASTIVLASFIPMIMNTGGNSGSQSSVAVIRSLALGDVKFKDIGRIVFKELRVSLICGGILSVANFIKILLFDNLIMGSDISLTVALVICLTLMITVVIAKIVGSSLPLLAKKIGFDPAIMASPFITTIVDAVSLVIYFQIASALLGI